LSFSPHRLYKPRRETPRNEPHALDDCGHSYSQWPGFSPLLHPAATAEQCLPAVRERRAYGVQLLPSLQPQTESELSPVPARGWSKRRLLSVLRNFASQPGSPRFQFAGGYVMMERIAEASPRFKARMTGVFEVLEGMTSAFGQVFVLGRLVVSGNAAATAANILGHERLFWLGFVSSLIGVACHIAWTFLFYYLFKPVN